MPPQNVPKPPIIYVRSPAIPPGKSLPQREPSRLIWRDDVTEDESDRMARAIIGMPEPEPPSVKAELVADTLSGVVTCWGTFAIVISDSEDEATTKRNKHKRRRGAQQADSQDLTQVWLAKRRRDSQGSDTVQAVGDAALGSDAVRAAGA